MLQSRRRVAPAATQIILCVLHILCKSGLLSSADWADLRRSSERTSSRCRKKVMSTILLTCASQAKPPYSSVSLVLGHNLKLSPQRSSSLWVTSLTLQRTPQQLSDRLNPKSNHHLERAACVSPVKKVLLSN